MKEYNIGLDIGVASVGWCVTDENGNLIKNRNKNLWGTRLLVKQILLLKQELLDQVEEEMKEEKRE